MPQLDLIKQIPRGSHLLLQSCTDPNIDLHATWCDAINMLMCISSLPFRIRFTLTKLVPLFGAGIFVHCLAFALVFHFSALAALFWFREQLSSVSLACLSVFIFLVCLLFGMVSAALALQKWTTGYNAAASSDKECVRAQFQEANQTLDMESKSKFVRHQPETVYHQTKMDVYIPGKHAWGTGVNAQPAKGERKRKPEVVTSLHYDARPRMEKEHRKVVLAAKHHYTCVETMPEI